MNEDILLRIEDATLMLHPERAAIWLERRTVIAADTHFGKSALFRRHGIPVPAGADELDRQRLHGLVRSTKATRLIVLGDFLHAPVAADSPDAADLSAWCAALSDVEIIVIAGNHDRGVLAVWRPPLEWRESDLLDPPFRFTHDADRPTQIPNGCFTLSGHVHPVIRLGALRRKAPRVPVFWERERGLVLPSFGLFTGGYEVTPHGAEHVYAVGPDRVVRFY